MKREIDKSTAVKRVSVKEMDEILGWQFPALDHGFVRVIDYMGDDAAVVQMARVSYGAGTENYRTDVGLIKYLMRHDHTSPFEGCEIKLHVKLPVFVARQWIRHRTANVNEYSARYSILADEFYIPEVEHIAKQSNNNKQGRGQVIDPELAEDLREVFRVNGERAYSTYKWMLDEDQIGMSRELARINIPVNVYTEWYWKTDLHNLLHFLRLRMDPHAQYEIRAYAEVIHHLLGLWVPVVAQAAQQYRFGSTKFSAKEMQLLQAHFDQLPSGGEAEISALEQKFRHFGASHGEAAEFVQKLKG